MEMSTHNVLSECIRAFVCLSVVHMCISCTYADVERVNVVHQGWQRALDEWNVISVCCILCVDAYRIACSQFVCAHETDMNIAHTLNYCAIVPCKHEHDIMPAYPPNLSILISGGKCTTLNSFSHCEWTRIKSLLETMPCALNCCIRMYCHSGCGWKLFATSSKWGWKPRMRPAHIHIRCILFE